MNSYVYIFFGIVIVAAIVITVVFLMKKKDKKSNPNPSPYPLPKPPKKPNVNPPQPVVKPTIPTATTGLLRGTKDGPYQPNLNPDKCKTDTFYNSKTGSYYNAKAGPVYLDVDGKTCIYELLQNDGSESCDQYCLGSYFDRRYPYHDIFTGAKYVYDPKTGVVLDSKKYPVGNTYVDDKSGKYIPVSCGCYNK